MEVLEVTKEYAIVDGEKIYFDESFEEEPDKATSRSGCSG